MLEPIDQRFPASLRIKLKRDFDRVFAEGVVVADSSLIVHAVRNDLPHSRIGLSIGRRYGKAHERNLVKRWCREAFRTQKHLLPTNLDFVVRIRAGVRPSFQQIKTSMPQVLKRVERKLKP